MEAPQLEDGFTRLANEWIEAFAKYQMSGREWQVLFAIIRKTYGFNKKSDKIALSQFEKITGIARHHVVPVIKKLESKKIIVVDRKCYLNRYYLNKDYLNWMKVLPKRVTKVLPKQVTTIDTKDNYKKHTVGKPTPTIIIKNESFMIEELNYEPCDDDGYTKPKPPVTNKQGKGNKTMATIAHEFYKASDIKITRRMDATKWLRPLSAIYRHFDKDLGETIKFIKMAAEYFIEKDLSYTPHTLWKDLELIEKWVKGSRQSQDISERRTL